MVSPLLMFAFSTVLVNAHIAVWTKGMYCRNGPQVDDTNENASGPELPLYMLPKKKWWFHASNGCNQYPPPDGEFLEIPAGGAFTVELSPNRATTTLSYNGMYANEWVDGKPHPEFVGHTSCITSPNMHTYNESFVAGTAFAISYQESPAYNLKLGFADGAQNDIFAAPSRAAEASGAKPHKRLSMNASHHHRQRIDSNTW